MICLNLGLILFCCSVLPFQPSLDYFNIFNIPFEFIYWLWGILFSKCFTVLHITFTSMIHFDLSLILSYESYIKAFLSFFLPFLEGDRGEGKGYEYPDANVIFFFFGKAIFPLVNYYWNFVKSISIFTSLILGSLLLCSIDLRVKPPTNTTILLTVII